MIEKIMLDDVELEVLYDAYSVEGYRGRREPRIDIEDIKIGDVSIYDLLNRAHVLRDIEDILLNNLEESRIQRLIDGCAD